MTDQMDEQLIQRARQGEAQALAELFRQYWPASRAAAYGVVGELNLAEDVASEAMGAALQGLSGLKDASKFGPWLHTIVVRTAHRYKRDATRRHRVELQKSWPYEQDSTSDDLEQREFLLLLHEAVEQLPDLQREAVILFYFEGYTVEQAAVFVDVPVGTLKRRLHEGRKGLQVAVKHIKAGRKSMDTHRQVVLKQLEELLREDIDVDRKHVREVIHQAMKLRPYPRDLMAKISKQHFAKNYPTPESRAKAAVAMKKMMTVLRQPSSRMTDPDHPLCQVAEAIKVALPTFEQADLWGPEEETNNRVQQLLKSFSGQGDMQSHLSDLNTFLYHTRTVFFQDDQGIWRTMGDLAQLDKLPNDLWQRAGLSDVYVLQWNVNQVLDLQTLEQCLRGLSQAVVPKADYVLQSYDSPQCRCGLRMLFEGTTLPAALGGVVATDPDFENGRQRASVMLCLEAWASALSGQSVELEDATPYQDAMRS